MHASVEQAAFLSHEGSVYQWFSMSGSAFDQDPFEGYIAFSDMAWRWSHILSSVDLTQFPVTDP